MVNPASEKPKFGRGTCFFGIKNKEGDRNSVDKYLSHNFNCVQNMAYLVYLFYLQRSLIILNEIGKLFRVTREEAGVSITEASKDLDIKEVILENIEDGNIGCFKDIFVLKDYIYNYSKYLGIDSDKVIDDFNEYMFEYTSKIPIKDIEHQMEVQNKTEKKEISSPYTKESKKYNKSWYVFFYTAIILLILVLAFWSIRQITISRETATVISYVK